MLNRSMAGLAVVVLALTLAGCGLQKGETMMSWDKGDSPAVKTVTEPGTYALYDAKSLNPMDRTRLETGDQFGFRNKGGDKKVAVVKNKDGEREIALDKITTGYYWKLERK